MPTHPSRVSVTRAQLGLITAVYLVVFTALLDVHIVIIALPALSWEH